MMKPQRPEEPGIPVSMQSAPQNRWIILVLLCVPVVGGILLFRSGRPTASPVRKTRPSNPLPLPGSDEPIPRVINFPSGGPNPVGKVALKDVVFETPRLFPVVRPFQRLNISYTAQGELMLTEWQGKQPVWRGPLSRAEFVEENIAGVRTLKKVLPDGEYPIWSDTAQTAEPDLKLERDPAGRARLVDKKGGTLWTGDLPPAAGQSSRGGPGDVYQIRAGGAVIDGSNGAFTVKNALNGNLLWSGHLPVHPALLVRDGRRFTRVSPNASEGGIDRLRRVRFEAEAGTLTILDDQKNVLGTRPVTILKVFQTEKPLDGTRDYSLPVEFAFPQVILTKKGTIFITCKDRYGHVIRRIKVYKDDRSSGAMG